MFDVPSKCRWPLRGSPEARTFHWDRQRQSSGELPRVPCRAVPCSAACCQRVPFRSVPFSSSLLISSFRYFRFFSSLPIGADANVRTLFNYEKNSKVFLTVAKALTARNYHQGSAFRVFGGRWQSCERDVDEDCSFCPASEWLVPVSCLSHGEEAAAGAVCCNDVWSCLCSFCPWPWPKLQPICSLFHRLRKSGFGFGSGSGSQLAFKLQPGGSLDQERAEHEPFSYHGNRSKDSNVHE